MGRQFRNAKGTTREAISSISISLIILIIRPKISSLNFSRSTFYTFRVKFLFFLPRHLSLLSKQLVLPMRDEQPGEWGGFLSYLQIAFLPCLSCIQTQRENSPVDWSDESLTKILSRLDDLADLGFSSPPKSST
ncbi:hypothetical protein TNIN_346841 [Trichonephila inaurata madagascariensis]|uniref:Uncharacterized protein n=1 Tax=Trichonephila inaurata madagascariensis TaxID=2747483 RepID=A0A8X6WLX0_9ARAC|nr:hypothetical protein TNIN_346841 [Trichonephila inaurata madagascariensis]